MKLLRCGSRGNEKPATIDKNGKIRDLSSVVKDFDPENLNFNTIKKIEEINFETMPEIAKSTRIGACINNPGKFIGIGLNYSDHAAEIGAQIPKEPIVFMKATSCISGPNDDIFIPKNSKKCDWEVETAFVIGKKTKDISELDSEKHILGYCIVNDISEREWQLEGTGQWVKGKSADTFGPVGPYLVTKDEIKNVQNLSMKLDLNGKNMQQGNTNKMIFSINFLLSYLSKFMTLLPGDIVTTGTPPGIGNGKKPKVFLKNGDKLNLSIDNLGGQNQKIKQL
jgi:2-keto-4-pentenoate hydratase/2-oxohepta-3-ene-1,7-dioic acid hydratase in catechol pathway|tara:strand:- start:810 stop:1652 length:843 start_codon:yes stop_codon:yes gene_type:complete